MGSWNSEQPNAHPDTSIGRNNCAGHIGLGELDDRADKYIGRAVAGAQRMQAPINDLLAYSRVGARGKPFEPTDCGSVVEEAIGNLQNAIDDSGTQIACRDLPTIRGDCLQPVQVFQNLVGNAIRYRGEAPPRIDIGAEMNGHGWSLSVRDNGIGIAQEEAGRIFVIFRRLHARSESDGNGIGLAIVNKVVERRGGQVWGESEPDQGSTSSLTLGTIDHGGRQA